VGKPKMAGKNNGDSDRLRKIATYSTGHPYYSKKNSACSFCQQCRMIFINHETTGIYKSTMVGKLEKKLCYVNDQRVR